MLLDNHHGPDPRIQMEAALLNEAGAHVRIVAWDRRSDPAADTSSPPAGGDGALELVRVHVPAPSQGGRRTFAAMGRYYRRVWAQRRRLVADADVLIVHDFYLLLLGFCLSYALRLPLVYDAHEDYAAMESRRYPRRWLDLVTRLENLLARRARAIVVPGRSRVGRWRAAGFPDPVVLRNIGLSRVRGEAREPRWDIAYCGTLADVRRLDVLVDAARARPELRVVIAGRGRGTDLVQQAAAELPNVDYAGWRSDSDELALSAKALFYGLDPEHPYSLQACPNTLYDALRLRRPLLYFCGGEVAEIAAAHRIGVRCDPDPDSLLNALDGAMAPGQAWGYDEAWEEATRPEATRDYVRTILDLARDA